MFPWEWVDGLSATKSKDGLIVCAISFQDFHQGPLMLNEAKISRPGPWGWDRGQSFEVKAEANFLTSSPRPRPKIKFWIKSIKWCWQHICRQIYIILIKTTQF